MTHSQPTATAIYSRVSTKQQDSRSQDDDLLAWASGKDTRSPARASAKRIGEAKPMLSMSKAKGEDE
jgi:hypothetical protein